MKKLSRHFIPNLGTLIILGLFLFAQAVGAFPFKGVSTQSATLPALINYQGRLNDAGGDPVPDGSYTMTFRLYSQATGGTPLWTEVRDVTVSNGLFNVMLGEVTSLPSPFPTDPLYLGVKVGADEEMTPRERLGSVPFALVASVPDGAITTAKLADGAVTTAKLSVDNGLGVTGDLTVSGDVGIGTTNPAALLTLQSFNTTRIDFLTTSANASNRNWRIRSSVSDAQGDDKGKFMLLYSTTQGAEPTVPAVTINSSGSVGIGTTNPSTTLDVRGAISIMRSDSAPFECAGASAIYVDSDPGGLDQLCFCAWDGSTWAWRRASDPTLTCD